MKNYYEILEVDKNASQEVIEKAYRTLAKKYHPDLQQGQKKLEYSEKMKSINQAYDVLSNSIKRGEYNQELENEKIQYERMQAEAVSREQHERIMQENYVLKQQLNRLANQNQPEDRGYKIRYKHDLKYYLKIFVSFIIMALIFFIVYQIPFVKNFFVNLYNENIVFQTIVNIFKNTFSAGF